MRIGVLTTVHAPLDTRIYFKEARSLALAGHEVVLIARRGACGGEHVHRVHLPVPRNRMHRLRLALDAFGVARRLRCDAYHFHDPELLPVGVALKLCTGARIVFDVHEHVRMQILDKTWIPKLLRPLVARLYGAVERLCLHYVDRVIVAMPTFAHHYGRGSVTVVHNYPILRHSTVGPAAMESGAGLSALPARPGGADQGKVELVYCGMLTRIRGALEMLEVVALLKSQLPQVHLTLIGPLESEALAAEVRAYIQGHKLEQHVTMLGRLPIDQAMERIAQADIGLALFRDCHNLAQALPTKILEYMTCGKPVVLSEVGMGVAIVRKEQCGVIVPPGDPAAAATAIRCLFDGSPGGEGRLKVMGGNGRRAVVERYQWNVEERKLLALYRSLEAGEAAAMDSIPGMNATDAGRGVEPGASMPARSAASQECEELEAGGIQQS